MNLDHLFATANHHPIVVTPSGLHRGAGAPGVFDRERASFTPAASPAARSDSLSRVRPERARRSQDMRREHWGRDPSGTSGVTRRGATYAGMYLPRRTILPAKSSPLHNEMSYLPRYAARVFPVRDSGPRPAVRTSLAHGRDVLDALPSEIVTNFRNKAVNYIRNFHPRWRVGKLWQATYQTVDRTEAEAIIAGQGSIFRWLPDGALRVSTRCDALTTHPGDRRQCVVQPSGAVPPLGTRTGRASHGGGVVRQRSGAAVLRVRGRLSPMEESALRADPTPLSVHASCCLTGNEATCWSSITFSCCTGASDFTGGERKTFAYLSRQPDGAERMPIELKQIDGVNSHESEYLYDEIFRQGNIFASRIELCPLMPS